jgi:phosphatidylserine/phosphatidylglycerophosphate/cardiolipin synthase-like enzyme
MTRNSFRRNLSLALLPAVLLHACGGSPAPGPSVSLSDETGTAEPALEVIPLAAGYGSRGGWYELYFTDPQSPLASQQTGGIDAPLANAIESARMSVDVAIYSLSLNSIRNALLRAHDRGLRVRMIMESDNLDRADPQILKEAGIPILGDRREGLMHNKFVVIDGMEVWVGGMNYTDSGAYTDNNVMMRIRSSRMAENYTKEFEEMFVDDKFGDSIVPETPHPQLTLEGTDIEVYFSPDDGVQERIVELVNAAEQSIYFMAFSFTSDPIGGAMRARAQAGVTVAGVMDEEQIKSNIGTEFDAFAQAGLDVYRDGIGGQMHHKIIIIDQRTVIFGSYNFTQSAETRNDENLLVIHSQPIAAQFFVEFQRVYGTTR